MTSSSRPLADKNPNTLDNGNIKAETPNRKPKKENNPVSPTGQLRSPSWIRSGNTGIHQAKMLVHSILNQVAFDDSPALHDDMGGQPVLFSKSARPPISPPKSRASSSVSNTTIASKSQNSNTKGKAEVHTPVHNFSRQHHIHMKLEQGSGMKVAEPSPNVAESGDVMPFLFSPGLDLNESASNSGTNSLSPSRTNNLPKSVSIQTPSDRDEALPMPPPLMRPTARLGQGPEAVMGNVSLAALCARTIESIDMDRINFNIKAAAEAYHEDGNFIPMESHEDDVVVERVESQEDMTQWQKEVEMAPTFASEDAEPKFSGGGSTRKAFLLAMDGSAERSDAVLFPGAVSMSTDESEFNGRTMNDSMNAILEEDEETDDILDIIPASSKEDGVILSSVAEGNEFNAGQAHDLNITIPTSNVTGENSAHNLNVTIPTSNTSRNLDGSLEPNPRNTDPGEIPMSSSLEFSTSPSTQSRSSALSPESGAANTKLTISPDRPASKPRMQMFGSEYARHLCSDSIFSPPVQKSKQRGFHKMLKKKKPASTSAAAAMVNSPTRETVSISANEAHSVSVMSGMAGSQSNQYLNRSQDGGNNGAGSVSTISNTSASLNSAVRGITLEDAPADVISAAITDVIVTHASEKPPKGYYRISQTSNGTRLETLKVSNSSGIGKRKLSGVYLNVKKEQKWDRAVQRPCVTALTVIFPDRNEFVPPGFCVVRRYKAPTRSDRRGNNDDNKDEKAPKDDEGGSSFPANLNYGTSGERVYLCYRRSREGNPVTGLIPLQPSNKEPVPEGYTVLERTPRNFVADINSKAGPPIFLAFRQRLANLETLRPLPLVLSVHYSNGNYQQKKKKKMRLKAYYCTGGTVVPSEIGKYHIMDRSTHPLISPSSVSNRLSLIQASRTKNSGSSVVTGNSSTGKNARSDRSPSPMTLANGLVAESPSSGASLQFSQSYDKSVGAADLETDSSVHSENVSQPKQKESLVDNILHLVNQISPGVKQKSDVQDKSKSLLVGELESDSHSIVDSSAVDNPAVDAKEDYENDDGHSVASSAQSSVFAARDDSNLVSCFDAMDFIPPVQCPLNTLGQIDKGTLETLLQARIAVLTPILTACYTHHGGSSLLAVEGLTKLLNDTEFFMPDVALFDDPNVNQRLTLLDLSIQVVCDVANSTARETNFLPCIEFVVEATNYAKGNLNARTIGYIIRFYLFVFYFGASVPTASSWPRSKTSGFSRKEGLDEANDAMLLSEEELSGGRGDYVPGGAPQAAALALKELITIFLTRLRKMKMGGRKQVDKSRDNSAKIDGFVTNYVESLIEGAVHQVDVSNYTQLALHQIHRSGGSELFWHDMMTSCGTGLFDQDSTIVPAAKDYYVTSFAILSSIVKVTSGKVRRLAQSSEFVPRDIASKLLSLELMHHFLHQWGKTCKYNNALEKIAAKEGRQIEDSSSLATMAYTIRRLVIPCLLSNTRSGLDDIKVFRRMMKIVTGLWCNRSLRPYIKIEIGVLIEHFVLKFLRLGPQVLPPKRLSKTRSTALNDMTVSLLPQQVCIVVEMKSWFISEPRDILELFMNFDQVDAQSSKANFSLLPSTHWKITQQMCGALCTLAEQCTDIVSDQIRLTRIDLAEVDSQSAGVNPTLNHTEEDLREMTLVREGARYLQEKCFDTIGQIVRSLMLCAAASSGANYNLLSKLREKQEMDLAKKQAAENMMKAVPTNADDDDSSRDSAGSMTVKSISTIGNIVGGIMNKKKDSTQTNEILRVPESPRHPRLVPQLTLGDDDGDGIVEYWQTSIAAERRKNTQPSPRDSQDGPKKPPRGLRISRKSTPSTPTRLKASSTFRGSSPMKTKSPRRDDNSVVSFAEESIRGDPHLTEKLEETLDTAFEIMQTKSLKKALDFLIACNILTPSPRDIASFLRSYQARIDTSMLGDYLGEGGKDGDEVEHYNLIRFHYTCAISFVDMNVEQGLRHFLTNCGFRLPGEAQKIDRIMTTFSQCFWEDNAGDHSRCPFQDQDTVFLIAFAIIMLNTDLHKTSTFANPAGQQSTSKQKQRKKMTKQEFLNNLRGVNNSEDISREYLGQIYDSIAQNPIAIYRPPENSNFLDGALAKKTIKFSSGEYGHIIEGNIDLAGMIKHVIKSVKPCQELLRGLAAHEHPYLTIKNSRKNKKKSRKHLVPEELVRSAFCSLWHHFHGTINSALDAAHLDPKGLENCLDVLMYTLCTTICLDLTVERNAFTSQLVRVKFFRENRGLEEEDDVTAPRPISRIRDHLDYKNDPWYMRIEKASESYHENAKIAALDEVDGMFRKLHASLKVDSTLKQEMINVARRIRNGQILLNDPTRYFLKEGELAKRCNRTGRNNKYTFFLFSDVLIYAHKSSDMYKIHGELPLHLMKIMDLNSAKQKKSFHLIHPRKSFVISAQNKESKANWLATINAAIGREVKRKARIEGARQNNAAFDR